MSDLFDSSLNLEEQFIEEGRQEGIRSVQPSRHQSRLLAAFNLDPEGRSDEHPRKESFN